MCCAMLQTAENCQHCHYMAMRMHRMTCSSNCPHDAGINAVVECIVDGMLFHLIGAAPLDRTGHGVGIQLHLSVFVIWLLPNCQLEV